MIFIVCKKKTHFYRASFSRLDCERGVRGEDKIGFGKPSTCCSSTLMPRISEATLSREQISSDPFRAFRCGENACVYGLHDGKQERGEELGEEATLLVFYLDRSDEKGRVHGDTILLLIKV